MRFPVAHTMLDLILPRKGKTWASLTLSGVFVSVGLAMAAKAEEACVRTTAGEVVCGTLVANPPSPSQPQRVEAHGFRFDLQSCTRNDSGGVNCALLITNLQNRDRELKLYSSEASGTGRAPSRAMSPLGEEFITRTYNLGNASSDGLWWKVANTLVSGIPMQAQFTFEAVGPQTTELALVEIGFYPNDGSYNQVAGITAQFRNVAITNP